MEVAPGIHRIGSDSKINAYLIEEGGRVTLVDAGLSGLYRDLPRELASMGRSTDDIEALVLTHGHSDHVGFAERLRNDHRVPVSVHEADAALARGEVPNPVKGFGPTKIGPLLGFLGTHSYEAGCEHGISVRCQRSATVPRSTSPAVPQ